MSKFESDAARIERSRYATDDITGREKKVFAMLDKNNDGKIEKSELPKGWRFGHHRQSDDDDSVE